MENIEVCLTLKQAAYHYALFDKNGLIREDSPYREFHYFGGFGSGKSRIEMISVDQICRKYKNAHGVFIRNTFPELHDSVIPQYHANFQHNGYVYHQSDRSCLYANGTRLDFRAFDRDTKILSNEYDFIAFCQLEEIPEELFLQSLGRNRRRIGGLPRNIILGEGNPSSGWVKTRLKDNPLPPEIYLIEARTRDNPYLPKDYEENMRKNYPDFWVARYLDGEWSNVDEAVFSEFREHEHIIEPVSSEFDKNFKKRAGFDYGWRNPAALVWGYIDYDGVLTVYDEWGGIEKPPNEIAKEAERHGRQVIVCDYSIKKPDRDGRSLWQDLEQSGLMLLESNKQELENIVLVNSLLKTGRLRITRNCVELIREVKNYKWKKMKLGAEQNHYEEPIQKDNHYIDALLYLVASLEEMKSIDYKAEKAKTETLSYRNTHKPAGAMIQRNS